jgi:hypothetical protein
MSTTSSLTTVFLETGPDGRARFRQGEVSLQETRPQLHLSAVLPAGGVQFRVSPPGYRLDFHCAVSPQWIFVVAGALEMALPDGTCRAGDLLHVHDPLPPGETFDPAVHGHASRQVGDDAVVAVMVKG